MSESTARVERRLAAVETVLHSFAGPSSRLRDLQRQADRFVAAEFQGLVAETKGEVRELEQRLAEAQRAFAAASAPLEYLERQARQLSESLRAREQELDRAVGAGELDGAPLSERQLSKALAAIARLRASVAEAESRRQRASLQRLNATSEVIKVTRLLFAARERLAGREGQASVARIGAELSVNGYASNVEVGPARIGPESWEFER
jgi:chromosome segregation ATPase